MKKKKPKDGRMRGYVEVVFSMTALLSELQKAMPSKYKPRMHHRPEKPIRKC